MISSLPKASASSSTSEVVLKTRTGKVKTTAQTLSECSCDMFDSFLRDCWKPELDKKGRRALRLDFDDKVFRRTLMHMQGAFPALRPLLTQLVFKNTGASFISYVIDRRWKPSRPLRQRQRPIPQGWTTFHFAIPPLPTST